MTRRKPHRRLSVDANGCLTETMSVGGHKVVVHYDDIPESDVTEVDGLPVTTPLRTVIDLAPELSDTDLQRVICDCLNRGLFTVDQALARVSEPDMATRPGAQILKEHLPVP